MARRLFLVLALCLATRADAGWPPPADDSSFDYTDPGNWPNDPGFSDAWELWSFVPRNLSANVDEVSKRLGTGMHVDRAFAKTIGDPRVIVAVTDSGIEWSQGELINQIFLNKGEIPVSSCPAGAGASGHDRNGDGKFNVQDYTTVTGNALPAFDKVCDSRITKDHNDNGVLDAQDLLKSFSDGKDDDGNGYTDDISGWDFFNNDNDPQDDTGFGHGTGASRDGMSATNNASSGAGTCPECRLVMFRVGDAFVPELNNWAMSVIYGVDLGVSVINISGGGGLTMPSLARDAMDYAYKNNVTVIVSNSDLDSFHHNFPNTYDHAIAVHAIRYDSERLANAHTFFNYNICTNYGANLMLSVPTLSCSSGAAGLMGGVAGLLYSAALKGNVPLPHATAGDPDGNRRITAEEMRQFLIGTIDNFHDPATATDPTRYPTTPGFARRFGYGRPNARRAADGIIAGKLPPEATIKKPAWFDVLYPDRTGMVAIEGRVGLRGMAQNPPNTTFDYVVEWAPGVDPPDSAWKMIGQAEMVSSAVEGPLAMWNISTLTVDNPVPAANSPSWQPDDPVNVHQVTLRVRVTTRSLDPNLNGLVGENRKPVHIYRDPDLLPAYPKFIGASGEGSPKLVDLDGDKKHEIVVGDSNGFVHALKADGSELSGWPVHVEKFPHLDPMSHRGSGHQGAPAFASGKISATRYSPIGSAPAVGDLDGDGKPEVVIATWMGYVWAFKADGSVVSGFPVEMMRDSATNVKEGREGDGSGSELEDGFFASPVLVDLDGDGKLEIIGAGMDARLYAWKGTGAAVDGFPVMVRDPLGDMRRQRMVGTPAAGDLNKDGIPDFVVGTNEDYSSSGRLYAIDGRGNKAGSPFLPGWPVQVISTRFLPVVAQGLPVSPAMGDVDGDGVPEIFMSGIAAPLKMYGADGKPKPVVFPNRKDKYGAKSPAGDPTEASFVACPAVGDLDDDGVLDVVQGNLGSDALLAFASGGLRKDFEHHVAAWDTKNGNYKRGFPQVIEDWQFFSTPAIADVDGDGKVEVLAGSGGYFVHGWNVDGVEAKGFPKFTGQWALTTPAIGDLDGDGKLELVQTTRNGYIFAWKTQGKLDGRVDWASFHHDDANTGNFGVKLPFGKGASPSSGCSMSGRPGPTVIWVVAACAAIVYAWRRRSRKVP